MTSPACQVSRPRLQFLLRLHLRASRGIYKAYVSLQAVLTGFWLGILGRDCLPLLDQLIYDECQVFDTEEWNRRGFFEWEKAALDRYFAGCKHLLVGGAGGGREVLALLRQGYDADGF